ncbi:RHS repeat protein [Pseudomonas sp. SWRI154]|uniref:RHS repeat protein n=1 Tax=Pseudomonas sp. SWRI154 TaxID=2745501 RepID=UPI00164478CE|nr:RHS repeat protein [Pseudomonas sp. SWRI154]MBC3362303.1 RHS repeat protein [Pseudomonas sp. SWRI154]
MTSSPALHAATPVLSVFEPRGLPARTVLYHRRVEGEPSESRIHRQAYDTSGRPVAHWDPRLWALVEGGSTAPANQTSIHSLSSKALAQNSVDSGWLLSLLDEAGQVSRRWDSRGTQARIEYDDSLRPVAMFEQGQGELERCAERRSYGGAEASAHNLCGQLMRHDDPAGSVQVHEAALIGGVIQQSRRFLREQTPPDWPLELSLRDALLEPAPEDAITQHHYNAVGNVLTQTDAKGHRQRFTYSVAGHLHSVRLQLAGQAEQLLLSGIGYNAFAQIETQTAGNGLVTSADYSPSDGRLMHLLARRTDGTCLLDLRYDYDPVGNVLSVRDEAQPVRFFNNQRIEPISTYRYDTLYQLIEATGREIATGRQGPALPELRPTPLDPNQLSQFTQTYWYDTGNNLTTLRHVGAQPYTHEMQVAPLSNRSVPKDVELTSAFDVNGNLLQLQPGQALSWDLRNQLQCVTPIERLETVNDDEVYVYDGGGERVRKIRRSQARMVSHRAEVRYLPGLELRTDTANGESLQVISVPVGLGGVRVLHWDAGLPDGMSNDQFRYSVSDHLGSCTLELVPDGQE